MDERELISTAIKLLDDIPGNLSPAFDELIVEARNNLEDALTISVFYKQYKQEAVKISVQDAVSANAEKEVK